MFLQALKVPFDRMIQSTMTRAQETAKIISTHIAHIPVETCELVAEGVPLEPSPPLPMHWRKEPHVSNDQTLPNFVVKFGHIYILFDIYIHISRIFFKMVHA